MSGAAQWRVSAVVPCYNSSATVEAALESALCQSIADSEIVAVDDGSTDGTATILDRYARRHPDRVQVLGTEHSGPYVARNLAARAARGVYLAFLDSDDFWEPEKLAKQVAVMEANPEVVLCHTGGTVVAADGAPIRVFLPQADYRGYCFPRLLVQNRLATSSVMLRRQLFLELGGFNDAFPARGDWELWTRVAQRGEFAAIDEALFRYRLHDMRMSRDTDRMRHYHFRIIDRHAVVYRGALPELERYIRESRFAAHMAYASEYVESKRLARARWDALQAIRCKPGSVRAWKLLFKALLGPEATGVLRRTESRHTSFNTIKDRG